MTELAVELRDVTADYGAVRALRGMCLQAVAGRVTALVGPNGAGKTSTLRVIAGLHPPAGGTVTVLGAARSRNGKRSMRAGVALSPEGRRLFADMSVRDNLLVGAFEERDRRRVAERLDRVYELFPLLHERRESRAGTLSGGQQQMVALGRALMRGADLLLLDEPTLGLSVGATNEVARKIREIAAAGTTTILVEQNAAIALELAEYAYIVEGGRVVGEGSSAEIRRTDALQAGYFGMPTASRSPA